MLHWSHSFSAIADSFTVFLQSPTGNLPAIWAMQKIVSGLWKMAGFPHQPTMHIINHIIHSCSRYPQSIDQSHSTYPDSKFHVAHMGPTWVLSAPGGPHVGPMNVAIRVVGSHVMSPTDSPAATMLEPTFFCCHWHREATPVIMLLPCYSMLTSLLQGQQTAYAMGHWSCLVLCWGQKVTTWR